MGNNKYSILYVKIACSWLGNRNVKIGNMTTVQMAVTDFVCLYNYEFWLSLCKIARSSVILLLLLFLFTSEATGNLIVLEKFTMPFLNKTGKTVVKTAPNSVKKMSKTLLRHTLIEKYAWHFCWLPWKSIVYNLFCRDGIYFDKILVSKYNLYKRSNKANLFIALVQEPVSQMKMTFQEIRIIATDKRDDFNFKIINFPNMCSNILASPAYGVYISQLIRYARASSNYSDFLKRHLHLRNRLHNNTEIK
jgi:hypothetical protein